MFLLQLEAILGNMNQTIFFILIWLVGILAFYTGKKRALSSLQKGEVVTSLPRYFGYCSIIWAILPALLLWLFLLKSDQLIVLFYILIATIPGWLLIFSNKPSLFHARKHFEKWLKIFLILCATFSVLVTIVIVSSVLFESIRFFKDVPVFEFLFGTHWSPQTAIREDQAGSSGAFGAVPLFAGTFLITFIAMCVAVPLGLFSAIYISQYASSAARKIIKPSLEILAGIPTVVYGYFAVVSFSPFLREIGEFVGLSISSESALSAGIVMGIMIIPFILSLSDDVINSVPRALIYGSLAMGATKSETVKNVIIPAALPGIISAVLLGISRGIGETMIVVMAAGLSGNLTINPIESVTTVTVQIVTLLVGDHEFDSTKTLAAFALGLTLFVVTLFLNLIALIVSRKYREKYD